MELNRRNIIAGLGVSGLLAGGPSNAATAQHTVFGVNTYDIFLSGLHPGGSFGTDLLQTLGRLGIPFARFAASAQWAGDWATYTENPVRYWAGMDTIFAAAEHNGVKLVPSVLWNAVALAYHLEEPVTAWASPTSKTSRFAKQYTEAFVERYDSSSALLMYEFCNEMNDHIDDVGLLKFWPKQDPTLPLRNPAAADLLNSTELRLMSQRFARTIRRTSSKLIGMGSNVPRGYAWHMARGQKGLDTRAQFIEQLRSITPPEMNVLSIHIYDRLWPWPKAPNTIDDVLAAFVEAANLDKRVSFLGEFGVKIMPNKNDEMDMFRRRLQAVRSSYVNYAAIWNVSLRPSQSEWNIIPGGDRDYQLHSIIEANASR